MKVSGMLVIDSLPSPPITSLSCRSAPLKDGVKTRYSLAFPCFASYAFMPFQTPEKVRVLESCVRRALGTQDKAILIKNIYYHL